MKIALLTTDTLHHRYFAREVARVWPDLHIVLETGAVTPPFATGHAFEKDREAFEQDLWFAEQPVDWTEFASCSAYESVNGARQDLKGLDPAVVVVFGTRKLQSPLMDVAGPARTINLHGGPPELYRGLDTHLWAIYHRDFAALQTCLHTVNETLDDGAIIDQRPIPLHKGMRLKELRAANTRVCVDMSLDALARFDEDGAFATRQQTGCGRYYSFMPSVLKDICVQQFECYTEGL